MEERVGSLIHRYSGSSATEVDFYIALWSDKRNREKATIGFNRLSELKQSDSFEVVVLIWPLVVDNTEYWFSWIHKWVEEQARERGFTAIDLLPEFSKVHYRKLQVAAGDSVHPYDLGHAMAADAFVKWYNTSKSRGKAERSSLR